MKDTLLKVLKVAAWSGGSAFVAVAIDQLTAVDWNALLGDKALFAVAFLNVLAVAAKETFKQS